jgi:hypothetical protein
MAAVANRRRSRAAILFGAGRLAAKLVGIVLDRR